jgi:hypothetical protein
MKEFYIQFFNPVVYVKLCQVANTQWVEIARDGKTFLFVEVVYLKNIFPMHTDDRILYSSF